MNRVICDVCGTKYPESSEQCPICGCAKPDNARITTDDAVVNDAVNTNNYTFVKGGRFSKANVRKRNKTAGSNHDESAEFDASSDNKKNENNKGLAVTAIILLLAVIGAMLFVFFKYFAPSNNKDNNVSTPAYVESTPAATTESVEVTTETLVQPCTDIVVSANTIHFDELGDTFKVTVELLPADTTDVVAFVSSDTSVVTVKDDGTLESVAAGEAEITITCGTVTQTCKVVVTDPAATTEETVPETTEAVVPPAYELKFSSKDNDITFSKKGETSKLYKGDAPVEDVIFTSDDPSVATFVNGIATAVAPGQTIVHAEYNGNKISCIVRCKLPADSDIDTDSDSDQNEQDSNAASYDLRIDGISVEKRQFKNDVTISVNSTFKLTLCNDNGDIIAVDWVCSTQNICGINGNTITGKSQGRTEISVNYSGKTYTCLVTVK